MSKKEFLDTLHQLLASLPTEERLSAVKYYEEYFEEAGPQQEEAILAELGTPQSIADALLRDYSGVPGTARQVAEDQAKAAASEKKGDHGHTTEKKHWEEHGPYNAGYHYQNNTQAKNDYDRQAGTTHQSSAGNDQPWYKRIPIWGWVLIGLFLWPFIGAAGGLLVTLLSVLLTLILVAIILMSVGVVLGVSLCIAGVALLVASCLLIPISPGSTLLMAGMGLTVLALGVLATYFGVRMTARWAPAAMAWFVSLCRRIGRIFSRKREVNEP